MSEMNVYYPRKMRVGWCVAHIVTIMGIRIERFGMKWASYREAYKHAEEMNKQSAGDGHNDTMDG